MVTVRVSESFEGKLSSFNSTPRIETIETSNRPLEPMFSRAWIGQPAFMATRFVAGCLPV